MDWKEMIRQLQNREPGLMDATGRYAVLVPLVECEDGIYVLYEVRSAAMRRQPGEVCFPGGRMEPGETPEQCALRETGEELGISTNEIEVLGQLDFIAHRANFIMYPVLARMPEELLTRMQPNPAEVGETFLVPIEYLLKNPPQEYTYTLVPNTPENFPYELIGIPRDYRWQRGGETVPVYPWPGHTIWGLTGRITRHLTRWLERWQECTSNS